MAEVVARDEYDGRTDLEGGCAEILALIHRIEASYLREQEHYTEMTDSASQSCSRLLEHAKHTASMMEVAGRLIIILTEETMPKELASRVAELATRVVDRDFALKRAIEYVRSEGRAPEKCEAGAMRMDGYLTHDFLRVARNGNFERFVAVATEEIEERRRTTNKLAVKMTGLSVWLWNSEVAKAIPRRVA